MELYLDGSLKYASASESTKGTELGYESAGSLDDIASSPEFEPAEIEKAEFEEIWLKAVSARPDVR